MPSSAEITQLLHAVGDGDHAAIDQLLPLVYDRLHLLARRERRPWRQHQTLNTTALVHEAYLKLIDQGQVNWENRVHFFRIAAKAMRYILLDYAKAQKRQKRGGDQNRITLNEGFILTHREADDLLALDEALTRLEAFNPRHSQIVECRFFVGMTIDETATALDLSPATVKRGWTMARTWLYQEIQQDLA